MSEPPRSNSWRRRYLAIWTTQGVSAVSSELVQFGIVWWLVDAGRSALVVSTLTMLALVPRILLGPVSGALVDRWNRRTTMMVADAVSAVALVVMVLLLYTGLAEFWHFHLVILVRAIAGTFQSPAMLASVSLLVPREHLSRAAGLDQMVSGLSRVAGPPLGAVLLLTTSLPGMLLLDVVSAIVAMAVLAVVPIPDPRQPDQPPGGWRGSVPLRRSGRSVLADIGAGWGYLRLWRGAFWMLALSTSVNFLSRPSFALIALVTTHHFGGAEREYGWMGAAFGCGVVGGGILLGTWGGFSRQMRTSLTGVLVMGSGIAVIGVAPASLFPLAILGMATGGLAVPIAMGPIRALIQHGVEPSLQGRVLSIADSLSALATPVSLVLAGWVFDAAGTQIWYLITGPAIITLGIIGLTTPKIRDLDSPGPRHATGHEMDSQSKQKIDINF